MNIKHLYIIGNGFDIFTGLNTRFSDFRNWLSCNYPFVYENLCSVYDVKGEWWNDFEANLGYLDVKKYVKTYTPPEKSIDKILAVATLNNKYIGDGLPIVNQCTPCADRLRGLLEILQYCLAKWLNFAQEIVIETKHIKLETENSYFINFNYTDVLQKLYAIPEQQILHIHGQVSKHEKLIFGHGNRVYIEDFSHDIDETCNELNNYEKNPYIYIYKHKDLPSILKNVEYVHIYGFSISEVDEDYLDWIEKNTPKYSKWEFSWYSDKDLQRINEFLINHIRLKYRSKLIKLEDIEIQRTF